MIDRNIQIQNIYYMLSYAFKILQEKEYKDLGTEVFRNTADLFSEILIKGLSSQIKRGLNREYIEQKESLSILRGKIDVTASIKKNSFIRKQIECIYDDYSVNSVMNKIIKSTLCLLLKSNIKKDRKKTIRSLLVYLENVAFIDLKLVNWNMNYNRNSENYKMLIGICYLTVKGLLQSEDMNNTKLKDFLDEQRMCRLYEKFILEYYRTEHPELSVGSKEIKWITDDGYTKMLPSMQSDIMLSKGNNILIIDAKYYSHTTQIQYGKHSIHSNNIYQIFTYIKNTEVSIKENSNPVRGMLLYARTFEEIQPDETYQLSGNQISIKTLDLNVKFDDIKIKLDTIVYDHFNNCC